MPGCRGARPPRQAVQSGLAILLFTWMGTLALFTVAFRAVREEAQSRLEQSAVEIAALAGSKPQMTEPLRRLLHADDSIKAIYACALTSNRTHLLPPVFGHAEGIDDSALEPVRQNKTAASLTPRATRQGLIVSGYAPLADAHGRVIGAVAVDLNADSYQAHLWSIKKIAFIGLGIGLLLALAVGYGLCFLERRAQALQDAQDRAQEYATRELTSAHEALQATYEVLEQRVVERTSELGDAYDATILGWSHALDLRDQETEGHSQRVTDLTVRLARAMGMSEAQLLHVRRGALLHDIGKMGIPDRVLLKPGPLTDNEWALMRRHPSFAWEMLWPIAFLRPALDIPFCHHEKWDGTGYPRGLRGNAIPVAARMFAIVDVWDALLSDRPYRAAWPVPKVKDHLRGLSGTHFDPRVVNAFLEMVSRAEAPADDLLLLQVG